MKNMFGQMMHGFFDSLSDKDKQKMKSCCEKMAAMCPCMNMEDLHRDAEETMMESMKSFCGGKMEMMSACFNKTNVQPDQTGSSDKT